MTAHDENPDPNAPALVGQAESSPWRIRIASSFVGAEEAEAAARVVRSGHLAQGAEVGKLEAELAAETGATHVVAVGNGTQALELSLLALGIGVGDEVVTSPFTFFSSVSSILRTGAIPVFADIDLRSCNVAPDAMAAAITSRTAALMPVHLYGRPCDMEAIRKVAHAHGLAVVEDACQAFGSSFLGKHVGVGGVGCFSFYGSKNVTCGEGGAITVDNLELATKLKRLRSHGTSKTYLHEDLSGNFRMTDVQAAILRVQLRKLDRITQRRREIARLYHSHLPRAEIRLPLPDDDVYASNWHQYTIQADDRENVARHLARAGIETRVYYPLTAYRQPAFPFDAPAQPVAEQASRTVLSLPIHMGLSDAAARHVAKALHEYVATVTA